MCLNENEKLFCQALAMTTLLGELSENKFLESDFYNKLNFKGNRENFREIFEKSGIGNPATMQICLYALLVMPMEVFKKDNTAQLKKIKNKINQSFAKKVNKVESTYKSDKNSSIIDFYNHVRNSVAHSNCKYEMINNKCYVEFSDVNTYDTNQKCVIFIETGKVGEIIKELCVYLMEYLNEQLEKCQTKGK